MTKIKKKISAKSPVHQNKISELPSQSKGKFPLHLKLAFLLGLVSFIVYSNTLINGFALDDANSIMNNAIVKKGIATIPELLTTPYHRGTITTVTNDLYRPLSLVMFATEYQLFGARPLPFHLVNVLLFAGCVILLFLFLAQFFDRKKTIVAFLAAL